MQSVVDEIGKELHVCAALMSDSIILRHHPSVVADHFTAALAKIEHLRIFLRKPEDACPKKPWLEASVLDGGIKKLVTLLVDRHMLPLRIKSFPKVFDRDLKQDEADDTDENVIEREIKETNCLGAFVVLYYYFFWHALLIILNQKAHACCFVDLDILAIFDKFPKPDDLLEERHLKVRLTAEDEATINGVIARDDQYLFESQRKTKLVSMYRLTFEYVRDKFKEHLQPGATRNPDAINDMHGLFDTVQRDSIRKQLDLFGGVYSTFHWQDDVSKWDDMYKETEIHSDEVGGRGTQVYTQRLANILKSQPFHAENFDRNARALAIYDYGSASLMTDVCKSFAVLTTATTRILFQESHETIESLLVQVCDGNEVGHKLLDTAELKNLEDVPESNFHASKFIQENLTVRRPPSTISSAALRLDVTVDDLMGYYWGSRVADWDRVNHRYVAWPALKIDPEVDSKLLDRLQYWANVTYRTRDEFALHVLAPASKNSLFISSIFITAKKIADSIKCTHNKVEIDTGAIFRFNGDAERDESQHAGVSSASRLGPTESVSLADYMRKLQLEYDALQAYAASLKKGGFRKFAGVSWPITGDIPNSSKFHKIRLVPAGVRTVQHSVNTMADLAENLLFERLEKDRAEANRSAAPPPEASQQFV